MHYRPVPYSSAVSKRKNNNNENLDLKSSLFFSFSLYFFICYILLYFFIILYVDIIYNIIYYVEINISHIFFNIFICIK